MHVFINTSYETEYCTNFSEELNNRMNSQKYKKRML